eukprot:CAMPEP_0197024274 /NCGR_PEP_ID=MMETSP1384-20130603/4858_1 /TAXON_ID=29189 /ORGANISM="Ammonia sp." /LENGTH=411 /DNA_ID=CAMNT_0042452631 /DNA_START=40 /DNA_END=1275 /DNA_ORIENTATION=-
MAQPLQADEVDLDGDDFDDLELRGSLENILEQKSLKWIFVGGKGGVGKTTTSCSLALMLALRRSAEGKKVLIISTDPAHNLSDAFGQQFGPNPLQIHGVDNLFAMEIDPKVKFSDEEENGMLSAFGDEQKSSLNFLSELSSSVPGIDEAMSFNELIKQVKKQDFDLIVFDTAPTGHTLRLLSFPTVLEKALNKLDSLKNKFGGLFSNFANALNPQQAGTGGAGGNQRQNDFNKMSEKLEEMKASIDEIKKTFENDDLTTFICVCIPEFLSLYETERLVQKLAKFGIDTHNIVINQVLFPEKNSSHECSRCRARVKMQSKYIEQFHDLYPDFHLTKIPLMSQEVRHIKKLNKFAYLLLNPYEEEYSKADFDEDTFFKDFVDQEDDEKDNDNDNDENHGAEPDAQNKDIVDID